MSAETNTNDFEELRQSARFWIEENFPKSLKNSELAKHVHGGYEPGYPDDFLLWRKRMGEQGWGAPTWPTQYGGGGLSNDEAKVVAEELNRAGAFNPIGGMGILQFGPTLLEYGTEEQKLKFIPPIARGEVHWCQGYSEPGAGSDLASLQAFGEDKGDHLLLNGQKTWTSGGYLGDWMFALIRTDRKVPKREGISLVMIDMKSPGVEVHRIKLIAGSSPFCNTFFTNVVVPKDQVVGPINDGWTIGKRLLQFERANIGGLGALGKDAPKPKTLEQYAKEYLELDDNGRIADPNLRHRIINHLMDQKALDLTVERFSQEMKQSNGPSPAVSIMKNAFSTIGQKRQEFIIEIMGSQGLGWEGDSYSEQELESVREWLGGKATTIYGGSNEIQNNIISKNVLGLPETTQKG